MCIYTIFSATADHCRWALHRGHVLLLTINSQSTMQSLWNSWRQTGMMLHRSPSSNGPRQIAQSWSTSAAVSGDDGSSPPAAEAAFRRGYVTRSSKAMAMDFIFTCAWSGSRASACCGCWWLFLLHKLMMMTTSAAMTKRASKKPSITDGPTMMIDNAMQGLLLLLLFIFLQKL